MYWPFAKQGLSPDGQLRPPVPPPLVPLPVPLDDEPPELDPETARQSPPTSSPFWEQQSPGHPLAGAT